MISAERWARRFHEVYEELAPSFGYETRAETRAFDRNSANGKLTIAVCERVVQEIEHERDAGWQAGCGASDSRA